MNQFKEMLPSVCLSHSCILLKPLGKTRYRLAETFMWPWSKIAFSVPYGNLSQILHCGQTDLRTKVISSLRLRDEKRGLSSSSSSSLI